jgi:hypothetical protein
LFLNGFRVDKDVDWNRYARLSSGTGETLAGMPRRLKQHAPLKSEHPGVEIN